MNGLSWRAACAAVLAVTLLSACSKESAGVNAALRDGEVDTKFPTSANITVNALIQYERVRSVPIPDGASTASFQRTIEPARFVDVVAIDTATQAEIQVAPAFTDASGLATLQVPRGRPFRLGILTSTLNSGRANIIVRDAISLERFMVLFNNPDTNQPFSQELRASILNASVPITIPARPDSSPPRPTDRPAAAFHILDSALELSDLIKTTTGTAPPTVTFFWNATSQRGSFFQKNLAGFGPSIILRGGDSSRTDTDDQDASVIRHEYAHAVTNALSRDASLGGAHGLDDLEYPSLAYSEGVATFLGALPTGTAAYVDTFGPNFGTTRAFTVNFETRAANMAPSVALGIRSEITVAEVLWDLFDGSEGRADLDFDGTALPASAFFTAFSALRTMQVYPSVIDILQAIVNTGQITSAAVGNLLLAPANQMITFPPLGTDVFPTRIGIPSTSRDTCVTRGFLDLVNDGVDESSRYFQFTLAAPTPVTISMTLLGADGQNASSTNIDLAVLNLDNSLATRIDGTPLTPTDGLQQVQEFCSGTLAAGTYIILVTGRVTNAGNFPTNFATASVSYQLDVTTP